MSLEGFGNGMPFLIAGREQVDRANRQSCGFKMVHADYFRVLGIQVVKGRGLTDRDVKGSPPVAVINRSMARRYFADQDPIGQRLLIQEIAPGSPQLGTATQLLNLPPIQTACPNTFVNPVATP